MYMCEQPSADRSYSIYIIKCNGSTFLALKSLHAVFLASDVWHCNATKGEVL